MKTVALAFVERAKTPPHSCKRRIPMIKLFLSVLAIALMLTSFTLVSSAGEAYTIPQCAVPPTIDGKMSKNEWYGAYHKFMNNEKGNYDYSDNPSPDVEDKANQCKGFDIYMYWYDDPNESGKLLDVKKGGLYICVVAQDKTYGTIFNDGEASNASDCFQLAIDPFNYRLSNSKKAFIFDFSPETTKKGTALIFEHYQFKSKPLTMFKYQVKAKRDKNGYTMEIFIPWSLLNLNDKLPRHKVGAKMGIGIICMDWVGARYYYDIADFGNGKKIVDIAGVPKLYNQVTFGETVYPPGYKSDSDLTKLNKLIKKAEEIEKNKAEYLEATYSAFELALKLAKEVDADIVLATDPDADRLGVYCKDTKSGEYVTFTGNMSGMLIAEYILREKTAMGTMPKNPALVETIVTTDMAKAIAKAYGVKLIEVLTGFKYIGEQIKFFEQQNTYDYVFGLEESYGCLAGTYARDKDACVAVMMLCEVASWCKKNNMTLWDEMLAMYEKYGYYREGLETKTLKGIDGAAQIQELMSNSRKNPPKTLGGFDVLAVRDYKEDTRKDTVTGEVTKTGLPESNVLYYELSDNAWCCMRPSGTEPKIKYYFGVKGSSLEDAEKKLAGLKEDLLK